MDHKFIVKLNKLGPVHSAEIILDGITVITGENGSGKSTISNFIYEFLKTNIYYENIAQEKFGELAQRIVESLGEFYHVDEPSFVSDGSELDIPVDDGDIFAWPFSLLEKCTTADFNNIDVETKNLKVQLRFLADKFLRGKSTSDWHQVIHDLKDLLSEDKNKFNKALSERSIELYLNQVRGFSAQMAWDIIEYSESIQHENSVNQIKYIQRVLFSDTPFKLREIPEIFKVNRRNEKNSDEEIDMLFKSKTVLDGDIIIGDFKQIYYKRADGQTFNLDDCATGLQQLAIFYLLYKNGHLDKDTLLILDEPEAHLHPGWIFEYARLVVLLNKKLDVKFLIASHNTDMLDAIKTISLAECIEENSNFYFAEPEPSETYTYNFVHKKELTDIFESFNKGFDKTGEYTRVASDEV